VYNPACNEKTVVIGQAFGIVDVPQVGSFAAAHNVPLPPQAEGAFKKSTKNFYIFRYLEYIFTHHY
jgi:hypothetical protein